MERSGKHGIMTPLKQKIHSIRLYLSRLRRKAVAKYLVLIFVLIFILLLDFAYFYRFQVASHHNFDTKAIFGKTQESLIGFESVESIVESKKLTEITRDVEVMSKNETKEGPENQELQKIYPAEQQTKSSQQELYPFLSSMKLDTPWDNIADDVVIILKTGHEVERRYLLAADTYLKNRYIPNFIVISDRNDSNIPGIHGMSEYETQLFKNLDWDKLEISNISGLPKGVFPGGWRGDKDKNLPGFSLAYRTFPSAKLYFMVDDDTYLFLDNLAEQFTSYLRVAMDRTIYAGRVFLISGCLKDVVPNPTFAHGGAGILLSNKALKMIYDSIPECIHIYHDCWAGDMQVAQCLYHCGFQGGPETLPQLIGDPPSVTLHQPFFKERWLSDEKPGTMHKIQENEWRDIYNFQQSCSYADQTFKNMKAFLLNLNYTDEIK